MRLWDWAIAAYGAPGVAEACLALQDSNEQNVPLLLWSAWVARTGRKPDVETIEAATPPAPGTASWSRACDRCAAR